MRKTLGEILNAINYFEVIFDEIRFSLVREDGSKEVIEGHWQDEEELLDFVAKHYNNEVRTLHVRDFACGGRYPDGESGLDISLYSRSLQKQDTDKILDINPNEHLHRSGYFEMSLSEAIALCDPHEKVSIIIWFEDERTIEGSLDDERIQSLIKKYGGGVLSMLEYYDGVQCVVEYC